MDDLSTAPTWQVVVMLMIAGILFGLLIFGIDSCGLRTAKAPMPLPIYPTDEIEAVYGGRHTPTQWFVRDAQGQRFVVQRWTDQPPTRTPLRTAKPRPIRGSN